MTMRPVAVDLTPELAQKMKDVTLKVLKLYDESGLDEVERFIAMAMALRIYEEATGMRLSAVIGIAREVHSGGEA